MSEDQQDRKITAKEAIRIAGDVIRDFYDNLSLNDLLLEEVRRGSQGSWLITMSFSRPPRGSGGGIAQFIGTGREYKQVEIDADGEFVEMEIRTLPKPPEERSSRF